MHLKNNFATILSGLSVIKLFQLSNGDIFFRSMPTVFTKCVNLKFRSLGRVSEVRAHYPSRWGRGWRDRLSRVLTSNSSSFLIGSCRLVAKHLHIGCTNIHTRLYKHILKCTDKNFLLKYVMKGVDNIGFKF